MISKAFQTWCVRVARLQPILAVLAISAASLAPRAQQESSISAPVSIARLHSAGLQHLNDTNGRAFHEIAKLPATVQLRDDTLDKVAAALSRHWVPQEGADGSPAAAAALIRPLLTDLCENEFAVEVLEHPGKWLESTLVIQLGEARRQLWEKNLSELLKRWTLRAGLQTPRLSLAVTNSWVALHGRSGAAAPADDSASTNNLLTKLREGARPIAPAEEAWVTLALDLPRWAAWLEKTSPGTLPQLDLKVSGRKEYLRSEVRLKFAEPLSIQPEPWRVPTETIRDPLISFTAVQGIATWLKGQDWLKQVGLEAAPNQLYLWGLSQTAFQLQAAMPVPNATQVVDRVTKKWLPEFNRLLAEYAVGNVMRLTDRVELVWRGLPLLVPYLNTVRENGQDYLHAGILPVDPPTNAAPKQLFQQITSQTNVLYYNWEITQARLNQLRPLLQLGTVFLTIPPMSTNSSAFKWLDAIEPRLGNTVTEVSLLSGKEVQLVRTSHLGLNGLELLGLAGWLEATNFPKLNPQFGFRPAVRSR